MEGERLTEYERKRIENIKRNEEMLACFNVHSKFNQLSSFSSSKILRAQNKSYKISPKKKTKSESPIIVTRRSLRTRGIQPDASTSSGLKDDFDETLRKSPIKKSSLFHPGPEPFTTKCAYYGESSDKNLKEIIMELCIDKKQDCKTSTCVDTKPDYKTTACVDTKPDCKTTACVDTKPDYKTTDCVDTKPDCKTTACVDTKPDCKTTACVDTKPDYKTTDCVDTKPDCKTTACVDTKPDCKTTACVYTEPDYKTRVLGQLDLCSFRLSAENVARVVPGRIMTAKFLPSADVSMIVVGNKSGNIGFWDMKNGGENDGDGIYLYRPHTGPVGGIAIQPFALSKIYTSCYDGYIRLMDVEKELFDVVYSSDDPIFSMSHQQNDANSLYFSEGNGVFNIWDKREAKLSTSLHLHGSRINSLDFSSENTNLMATSSTDGSACIWDLRKMNNKDQEALVTVNHKRAVHSAYFSPSGTCLATTSLDDNVGLITGANFEDVNMISHNNRTGRWISSFRAIWGWDDSYLYIGNMKRGVDVISTAEKRNVATLQSEYMSAIPCRFDAHPSKIGMLAGATSGGQVYVWTN